MPGWTRLDAPVTDADADAGAAFQSGARDAFWMPNREPRADVADIEADQQWAYGA
jgi:hypothetical protein